MTPTQMPADRNFCTVEFLCEVVDRHAYVVARRHGNLRVEPESGYGAEAATDRGWVGERRVWVCWGGGRVVRMRQVRVRLRTPTDCDAPLWFCSVVATCTLAKLPFV